MAPPASSTANLSPFFKPYRLRKETGIEICPFSEIVTFCTKPYLPLEAYHMKVYYSGFQ
jgi:hypothetical protein